MNEENKNNQNNDEEMNQENSNPKADRPITGRDIGIGLGIISAGAAAAGFGIKKAISSHREYREWKKANGKEVKKDKPKKHFHIGFVSDEVYKELTETQEKKPDEKVNKK